MSSKKDLDVLARDFVTNVTSGVSKETLPVLVARAMENIEAVGGVQGPEKKRWVLGALKQLVKVKVDDPAVQLALEVMVDQVVPAMIDVLVAGYNRVLVLGREAAATGCFGCCAAPKAVAAAQKQGGVGGAKV